MPIVVTCPSCSQTLKAPDAAAGKKVKCPKCTSTIMVPAAAAPPQEDIVEEFMDEAPAAPARRGREADVAAPRDSVPPPGQISRQTVGLVAMVGGVYGLHKFVLGKTTPALITLLVSVFGCGIGAVVMLVIGIMEGIKYLRMSDEEFYETYVAGDKSWL